MPAKHKSYSAPGEDEMSLRLTEGMHLLYWGVRIPDDPRTD